MKINLAQATTLPEQTIVNSHTALNNNLRQLIQWIETLQYHHHLRKTHSHKSACAGGIDVSEHVDNDAFADTDASGTRN